MEFKDRLVFCNKCENKKFDFKIGVVCGLTDSKPDFSGTCKDFEISTLEKQKKNAKEYTKKINNEAHNFSDDYSVNKNKDKLSANSKAFLKELKESEYVNRSQSQEINSETSSWKIVLSIVFALVALIRLIMIFVG